MLSGRLKIRNSLLAVSLLVSSWNGVRCTEGGQKEMASGGPFRNPRSLASLVDNPQTPPDLSSCRKRDTYDEIFASDPAWEDWSADVTEQWRGLLPLYQLARSKDFNKNEPYGIAMFHQIHCIVDIRQHYSNFLNVEGTTDEDRDFSKSATQKAHMAHCFNWLRQAILCHADDTKELLQPDPSGGFVDRTSHICSNAAALYEEGNGYLAPDEHGKLVWHNRPSKSTS